MNPVTLPQTPDQIQRNQTTDWIGQRIEGEMVYTCYRQGVRVTLAKCALNNANYPWRVSVAMPKMYGRTVVSAGSAKQAKERVSSGEFDTQISELYAAMLEDAPRVQAVEASREAARTAPKELTDAGALLSSAQVERGNAWHDMALTLYGTPERLAALKLYREKVAAELDALDAYLPLLEK